MATVSYSLSAKPDKASGRHRIYLRFCYGANSAQRAKTNYLIHPDYWDDSQKAVIVPRNQQRTSKLKQDHDEIVRVSIILPQLSAYILREYDQARSRALSPTWLKQVVESFVPAGEKRAAATPSRQYGVDMIRALSEIVDQRGLAPQSYNLYKVTLVTFERFIVYSGRDINFINICHEDIEEFREFLLNEHKLATRVSNKTAEGADAVIEYHDSRYKYTLELLDTPFMAFRGRSLNTVYTYLVRLSIIFAEAVKRGYLRVSPLVEVDRGKLMFVKHPIFLTPEELSTLAHFKPSTRKLTEHKDVFVFQCLVACRYGDLRRFRKDSVSDGVLQYIPEKTKHYTADCIVVPLNDDALEIIEKYKDRKGDALLPTITTQEHNQMLKKVFREAGLDRIVTVLDPQTRQEKRVPLYEIASSHLARRTFIGNTYNEIQDPNLISAITGHVNGSRSFARYRDITLDTKKKLVSIMSIKK